MTAHASSAGMDGTDDPAVQVFESPDALIQAAADEFIRSACEATAQAMLSLAAEAEALAAQCRADADNLAAEVRRVGDAHAKQAEAALLAMKAMLATIAAERVRLTAAGEAS